MKYAVRLVIFLLIVSSLYAVPTIQLVQPTNMALTVSRPVTLRWEISPQSSTPIKFQVQIGGIS